MARHAAANLLLVTPSGEGDERCPKLPPDPVRARLLQAALECFLADECHNVTTRLIAERADANISMIRYDSGNKKVLALNQGPGRRFIHQLLERARTRGARKFADLKADGQITPSLGPDILRMAFVGLAMTPMLLKEIFEESTGHPMVAGFLEGPARFNGRLFTAGLMAATREQQEATR